jgi:hypothetical protein
VKVAERRASQINVYKTKGCKVTI